MADNEGHVTNNKFNHAITTTMAEYGYTLQPGRTSSQVQDLTPYSAVSSFNLPAHYDSSLITPVSLINSPSISTKGGPASREEKDIKLSPSPLTPYQFFAEDEDFGIRYHSPMKHKDPSNTLQYHTDSPFETPNSPPEPFWGPYLVSSTGSGVSSRTMDSSPVIKASPELRSAGVSNLNSYRSYGETPPQSATSTPGFLSNGAPILNAPNPLSLRPRAKIEQNTFRHTSLQSMHTLPSFSATISPPSIYNSPEVQPVPRKRKSPEISQGDEVFELPELPRQSSSEEIILMEMVLRGGKQWKELVVMFEQATGSLKTDSALQMRTFRYLERMLENAMTGQWPDWDEEKWDRLAEAMDRVTSNKGKWTKAKEKWLKKQRGCSTESPARSETPARRRCGSRRSSNSSGRRNSSSYVRADGSVQFIPSENDHARRGSITTDPSAHQQGRQRSPLPAYGGYSTQQQPPQNAYQSSGRQQHQYENQDRSVYRDGRTFSPRSDQQHGQHW